MEMIFKPLESAQVITPAVSSSTKAWASLGLGRIQRAIRTVLILSFDIKRAAKFQLQTHQLLSD